MSRMGRTGLGVIGTAGTVLGLGVVRESFGLAARQAFGHAGVTGLAGTSGSSGLMPRQALDGAGMLADVGRLRVVALVGVQGGPVSCRCLGMAGLVPVGGSSLQAMLFEAVGAEHAFLVGRALPGMRDSELAPLLPSDRNEAPTFKSAGGDC